MNRLTERNFEFTSDYVKSNLQSWSIAQALKKLQEYENKEEDSLLFTLPCKVGDTIYRLLYTEIVECKVKEISITKSGVRFSCYCEEMKIKLHFYLESFGKNAFLSRVEAEEEFFKMEEKEHE